MNLNNQPTIDDLAGLFASRKDTLDNHLLWVCESGEVHIDSLPPHSAEDEFEKCHPSMRVRLQTYRRGKGYVGKRAAADRNFVGQVLDTLKQEWSRLQSKSGLHHLDRYC